jgi:hypothetical protein
MLDRMTQQLGTHLGPPLLGPSGGRAHRYWGLLAPRPIIIGFGGSARPNELGSSQKDPTTEYPSRPNADVSRAQHHWVILYRMSQHHWVMLGRITQQLGTHLGPTS